MTPTFMIVAGELSGDILGAGLIKTLQATHPDAKYIGIGGPLMIAAGLNSIAPLEQLSIMGLVEVLKHLPTLLAIKKKILTTAISENIVAYIGIDAPDFNLRCAQSLKNAQKKGKLCPEFKTIHYVSPSVWVWREGRIHNIKKAIDRVLCLFPFEIPIYNKYQVDAVCVGHRLADEIPLISNTKTARDLLGLDINPATKVIALLPGSRVGEVTRLIDTLLHSIISVDNKTPSDTQFKILVPAATPILRELIETAIRRLPPLSQTIFKVIDGNARLAMQAADAVLLASGTASLEAMLLKKPMVVVYKFSALTAWIARRVVKISLFSLPNILAGSELVPELFQDNVTPENIVPLLEDALKPETSLRLSQQFLTLHHQLRFNSDQKAAQAILEILPTLTDPSGKLSHD